MVSNNWSITETGLIDIKGQSEIHLGMTLVEFNLKYYTHSTKLLRAYVNSPRWFCYEMNEIINLHFNAENGTLEVIYLEEGFEGKYKGKIGIGSKISEIIELEDHYTIDDDVFSIRNNKIGFVANEDLETLYDHEIPQCKVERIILYYC